jgi:hypothetical protein
MLNENAQKWVNALRCGRFAQSRLSLINRNGYCCLGVGCAVARENGVDLGFIPPGQHHSGSYDGQSVSLPSKVVEWLGLSSATADYLNDDGEADCLVNNNDVDGLSFSDIADMIESKPQGLFLEEPA